MLKIQWFFAALLIVALIACSGGDKDGIEYGVNISEAQNVGTNSVRFAVTYHSNKEITEVGCMYSTVLRNLDAVKLETYTGASNTDFGVVFGTPSESETFNCDILDLLDNTEYFVKPYIKLNDTKESYNGYYMPNDQWKSFTTLIDNRPSVSIGEVTGISIKAATLYATVSSSGNPPYIEKGFCYGTVRNPAKGNSTCIAVTGVTLDYSLAVSNLAEKTAYYVRAYIENVAEPTQYSKEITFTTATSVPPSVSVDDVVVSAQSVTASATVTHSGNPAFTEKGFCYGITSSPAKGSGTCVKIDGANSSFSLSISDLANATRYYIRAYIDNGIHGTKYSSNESFTTSFTDSRDNKTYRVEIFGSAVWMIDDIRYNTATGHYTWDEALTICPDVWHLPNNGEWSTLKNVLGTSSSDYFSSSGEWWSATEYNNSGAYYYYSTSYMSIGLKLDWTGKSHTSSVRCGVAREKRTIS